MPTNRRRRRHEHRSDAGEFDESRLSHMLWGMRDRWGSGYRDAEGMADDWAVYGELVLAEFTQVFPGCRPFAWWLCEGVPNHGERRRLTYAQMAAWCEANGWPVMDGQYWRPDRWADAARQDDRHSFPPGIAHEVSTLPPHLEPEVEYLRRHKLLAAGERRAIRRGDGYDVRQRFDPDRVSRPPELWPLVRQALYGG